jgi:hypothetical protein
MIVTFTCEIPSKKERKLVALPRIRQVWVWSVSSAGQYGTCGLGSIRQVSAVGEYSR